MSFVGSEAEPFGDIAIVLTVLWNQWNNVFKKTLGHTERSLVSELREHRNKWAHQNLFPVTIPIVPSIPQEDS
jgi:uncharacterized membrane protein